MINENDKAGVSHWDSVYENWPISIFNPHLGGVRYLGRRKWHALFLKTFTCLNSDKLKLVEIGCGGSKYLPYFSKNFNFKVAGIDYSKDGCLKAEENLKLAGIDGSVYQADLFTPPAGLIKSFDIVVSFGLIEHFTNTSEVIRSMGAFAKNGGLILTIIPNMPGIAGIAQKLISKRVYDVHIPLTAAEVKEAHEQAGYSILDFGYLEFVNFGVVNPNLGSNIFINFLKNATHKILLGLTLFIWTLEKIFGSVNGNKYTSPYIFCIAKKPNFD
jgi:SAM-dependent methyltransferase